MPRKYIKVADRAAHEARMAAKKGAQGALRGQAGSQGSVSRSASQPPSRNGYEIPEMTEGIAEQFALLLHAGCPALRATLYVVPGLAKDAAEPLTREWMQHPLIHQAVSRLTGGEWVRLDPEKRYQLSLEKLDSEAAFYLWANNFNDIEHGDGLKKIQMARELLQVRLKVAAPDDADPLQAFARFAVEMLRSKSASDAAQAVQPPDEQATKLDDVAAAFAKLTTPKQQM